MAQDIIFSEKILLWYKKYRTQDLPWQLNKTMYKTWLSEIMLQQTQVKTVIVYYERFISKFPTIKQLATAELDEVLFLWSGLGYYVRARNLHKTANIILNYYHGNFPKDFDTLISFPGIGKSTAGAILSLTLDQHYPILDGNVKRILIRYYALDYYLSRNSSKVNNKLWLLIEQLLPNVEVAAFNQAMMDLGRLICTNMYPLCSDCPLQENCQSFLNHCADQYPRKKLQKRLLKKTIWFLLLLSQQYQMKMIWLEKRSYQGIWGGLFCFPEFSNLKVLNNWLLNYNLNSNQRINLSILKHKLSNIDLEIKPILININKKVNYKKDGIWYDLIHPPTIGLPKPISTLLQKLQL
ncbi:A/G-specific adenine glycosylase [Blochmannia endosymbiont of Camponotus sp. C-003]|uniref:A/G-specific adenine glycosylase n=1 Tax=unclassified Candidatus Blochmanniella TaxID=711328 RepID=UPI002024111F|nr:MULTISPECIES: A/G-specific adenine glycosylase [unclassified Candidatus Blochmannia]URJ23557.1 A/G-specific adenine glycosylase [Blochmannia endosymbiont of Camponotus sp. C-003]URJ29028.1 A/G-specific adenine glycosylase [Blochmannia endosymbiont of Camponotus sp. C-046]